MFNKYGEGEHVLLLNSCSPDQAVTNSNQSLLPILPIVPPRLDGIPVHVPESLGSIQCRILSPPTLHVSNFEGEHVLLLNSCSPDQVVTNSNQSLLPILPIVPPRLDGIPVHVPESLWSIQCRILSPPTLHVSNFLKNNFYVASASGQTANPVLPIDGVNVALGQTTKPVRSIHYDQPSNRLAVNVTLLHRFSKSADSMLMLKELCQKFKNTGIYFFNSNLKENEKFTVKDMVAILKEFDISEGKILTTYGQDSEAMDKERITHVIDNRPKQMSKIQTMKGFIRKCYCIGTSNTIYPNIQMFSTWADAAQKVLSDVDLKVRLEKYDHTACTQCGDMLCHGECHIHEELHNITETFGADDDKFVVVSWNVRTLRKCYLDGKFTLFIKETDADFIFLQEVSASPSTLLCLPGFQEMLKEYGFEYTYWFPCKVKPHYSGTALLARIKPDLVIKGFSGKSQSLSIANQEGRVITAILGNVVWVNAYFPTLTLKVPENERKVQRRIEFQQGYDEHLQNELFKGRQLVICGDLNTTRSNNDLRCFTKRVFPESFPSTTKMEREFLEKVITQHNLIDAAEHKRELHYTFKGSHPEFPGLRMRLDYFLIPNNWVNLGTSKEQKVMLESFKVLAQYSGSDHLPVRLETRNVNHELKYSEIIPLQRMEQSEITRDSCKTQKRCWSVTRKGKKFICYNGNKCKYSHVCVCEILSCNGNCLEMEQYQSIPKTRKFRKSYQQTMSTSFNTVREIDHRSDGDIEIAKAIHELPMLLEKTSLVGELSKTLFDDITLIIEELGRSLEKLEVEKTSPPVKSCITVKIKDVHEEKIYQREETIDTAIKERVDISVGHDKKASHKVDSKDLDRIFDKFDPDKFEISKDMIDVLLKIDSKPQSELRKGQGYFEQIQNREVAVGIPAKEEEASVHNQLHNEAWRSIQTLYYIYLVYADITRSFVQSTRYCGEWENLTVEDCKQMEVYFYPVRNILKSIKQLQLDKENADKVLTSVYKHCYRTSDTQKYAEQQHTEGREEIPDGFVNSAIRKTYCPHVNIKIGGHDVSVTSLLDTGSTYCIITRSYLKTVLTPNEIHEKQVNTNIRLQVANGQITKPLKKISLSFDVGLEKYEGDFYIMDSDASYKVILGCSFFEAHGAQMNFKNQQLVIPSKSQFGDESMKMNITVPFTIMQTELYRKPISLHCCEDTVVEPYSEAIVKVQATDEECEKHEQSFGEVWSRIEHHNVLRGANGFNYLSKHQQQGYTVINPTSFPITIKKRSIVAEFYPTQAECFGSVFNIGDIGEEMPSVGTPNVELKTNFTVVGPDVPEGINMPTCQGQDYTSQGGFREIKPASLIDDYSQEDVKIMFRSMGLSDLVLSPNKEKPQDCQLTPELETLYFQMQAKRKQVYSKNNANPLPVKYYTVSIPWTGEPRQSGIRPYSPEMIDLYKLELNPFIDAGVLIPSKSPWRSAVMLVIKPDGKTWRMVTDFRMANKQVKKRNWPLPRIDATLTAIAGAKFFSSVDQNNCYFQLPLADIRSRDWATIQTPLGVFSYSRCPQGYINSQADLMRFMDLYVTAGLSWRCCLAYSDDCIIWSRTGEQHIIDIDSLLCRIEYFGIQLKASKCEFFVPKLVFLGYEISAKGIQPSSKKTSAVMMLPIPQTSKDLKGFCAKVGYYRHNMKNLAEKLAPLSDLERKNCSWPHVYTKKEEESFENVKAELCSENTMLAVRDLQYKLAVDADGSKYGVAGALIQLSKPERPIMYASRKLKEPERLYHAYAIEVLAVVFAMTVFRPWIVFEEFILRIDCVALRWLMTTDQSSMFIRWVMMICEYRFKTQHRPGKLAIHVDYMSRNPVHEEGYYGEQPIEGLYCPITSTKHLISKVDEALETHNAAEMMKLCPVEQFSELTIPVGILDVEVFQVEQQLYLEISTVTQRLIYQILSDGAHQYLVEGVRTQPVEVVEIKYVEILNWIALKTCSKDLIDQIPDIRETLYSGSCKPRTQSTTCKAPNVVICTQVKNQTQPLWKESTFIGLYPMSKWFVLKQNERLRALQHRIKQGLDVSLHSMLELKTGTTLVMRTKKPLLSNVWLTSATNKPLVKIQADQIHANVFQTVEQVKSEMLDPRNWNAAQFMIVTPISGKDNCQIQHDIENGITVHTIRKIPTAEPLYVSSLNVVEVAMQLHGKIQTICHAMKEIFIPHITPVNMYHGTSWDNLEECEQDYVIETEVDNINHRISCVQVRNRNDVGAGKGVFATEFIGKNIFLSIYAGEELNESQVDVRYPNQNDSVYLFQKTTTEYVDAIDPRKSNFTRFINCPGIGERPNCSITYNARTKQLDLKTLRILVPEEELVFSYGPKYHFMGDRLTTNNHQLREKYALRGKRNENISELNANPPLRSGVEDNEIVVENDEPEGEIVSHPEGVEDDNSNQEMEEKIARLMSRIQNIEGNLLDMLEHIYNMLTVLKQKVKENVDQLKHNTHQQHQHQPANSAQLIVNPSKGVKRSLEENESWEPSAVKKPRVRMFNEIGIELQDYQIQKELYTRQKVKVYHSIKETLPYLFKDPNQHLPKRQFEIDDGKLRMDDENDPGAEVKLLPKDLNQAVTPTICQYFPNLSKEAILDVQELLHEKKIVKLDDMVAHIEDELVGNKTNELFRKWNNEDKNVQYIVGVLNKHSSSSVEEVMKESVAEKWVIRNYRYVDGLLWRINHHLPTRHGINTQHIQKESLYVPDKVGLRETILRYYHGTVAGSHPGSNELQYKIRSKYYWPKVRKSCVDWVKGCDLCANRKLSQPVHQGLNYPTFIPKTMWPLSCVLIDFIHGLPDCGDGITCICVLICQFSRYPWAFPCDSEDADNAMESVKTVVCSIPYPIGQLIADRGCGFTSLVMKKLCTDLDIRYKYTSTHSPVGGVEIFNKYLITCLSLLILKPERRLRWKRFLDPILYCFRNSSGSVGYSPFKIMYGLNPPNPIDVLFDVAQPEEFKIHNSAFRQEMTEIYKEVRKIRQRAAILQTIYKNLGQKYVKYEAGDLVRIWLQNHKDDRYYTVGRIIDHPKDSGFAWVKMLRYGKWHKDRVRIQNMKPYNMYSDEHFTSAPEKYSVSQKPPEINEEDRTPKPTEIKHDPQIIDKQVVCKKGDFVVIPADLWVDIERDKMSYSIAKCLLVQVKDNVSYGIFQRYGNYQGKQGVTQKLYPGYIDRKDSKYFYSKRKNAKAIPYTNQIKQLKLPEVPIRLQDILVVFPQLQYEHVPKETQTLIDKLFPEILQFREKSM